MQYAPILLEVVDAELKELLKCNFIIQVYNAQGQRIYERKL